MWPQISRRRRRKHRSSRLKYRLHFATTLYAVWAKRYAVAVDTADIVNMKRERAVDTGEVQAEGVKHETATRRKRWTPGSSSEPRH